MTRHRSTSRLSSRAETSAGSNLDGMEIEVVGKATGAGIREERDGGEGGEGEGEYVVMKRVVQLPRKVWCGRNVSGFYFSLESNWTGGWRACLVSICTSADVLCDGVVQG